MKIYDVCLEVRRLEIHQVTANSPEEAIKIASEGIETVDGVTEVLGGSADPAESQAA